MKNAKSTFIIVLFSVGIIFSQTTISNTPSTYLFSFLFFNLLISLHIFFITFSNVKYRLIIYSR